MFQIISKMCTFVALYFHNSGIERVALGIIAATFAGAAAGTLPELQFRGSTRVWRRIRGPFVCS